MENYKIWKTMKYHGKLLNIMVNYEISGKSIKYISKLWNIMENYEIS